MPDGESECAHTTTFFCLFLWFFSLSLWGECMPEFSYTTNIYGYYGTAIVCWAYIVCRAHLAYALNKLFVSLVAVYLHVHGCMRIACIRDKQGQQMTIRTFEISRKSLKQFIWLKNNNFHLCIHANDISSHFYRCIRSFYLSTNTPLPPHHFHHTTSTLYSLHPLSVSLYCFLSLSFVA